MPALKAIISGDASQYESELHRVEAMSVKFARKQSTIFNANAQKDSERDYSKWWSGELTRRDVEAATRSNKARALLRQRAAERGGAEKIPFAKNFMRLGMDVFTGNWAGAARHAALLANSMKLMPMLLNPVTGIIVGLVAGFAAAYKLSQALVDRLSGLKMPDIHLEYVAKYLQKINAAVEGQKAINKEVQKTVDLYNSAAKAAERNAKDTTDEFEHVRKMAEYYKEAELNKAKTAKERHEIEKRYSDQALLINEAERSEKMLNMKESFTALAKEAEEKKKQADRIVVSSKESDQNITNTRKQLAKEAQEYLDGLEKTKGSAKEKLVRGYNAVALSGVSGKDLDKAEADNKLEARRRIKSANDWQDQLHENDLKRTKKDYLTRESGASASKAAGVMLSLKDQEAADKLKTKNEADEAQAKLNADAAKSEGGSESKAKNLHGKLTGLQSQGAYASPASHVMIDTTKKMERHLASINAKMDRLGGHSAASLSGVKY
jgi:hypothetical protein